MVDFRSHRFHDLTEAFQIFTHILKLDSLLFLQKLKNRNQIRSVTQQSGLRMNKLWQHKTGNPYRFDALVKNGFVDKIEFAKFTDEFDVSQHLDLCNSTLLLLLRSEWVVMFVKDCRQRLFLLNGRMCYNKHVYKKRFTHGQHSWHGFQIHLEV